MKQQPLKIAMFFSSDPSVAGGVQEQLFFLSNALIERGHTVDIFGPITTKSPFHTYTEVSKLVPIFLPNGNAATITTSIPTTKQIFQNISKGKYDILHIHEPFMPFVAWDLVRQVEGVPIIGTFHTAWDDTSVLHGIDPALSLLQELYTRYFCGTIYVSHLTAHRWHHLVKPGNGHLEKVIGLGVDSRFKPKKNVGITKGEWPKKSPKLLFVGRLVSRKGVHFLLESFEKILKKFPKASLTIVGDGERRAYLESRAQELGIGEQVTFVGEVMGKDRIRYFQDADLFCAPYTDEAFGLTVVEAMACGCPIVGFDNHAFEDTLSGYPERAKLLVPYKNTDLLAKAMMLIITDQALHAQIKSWCIAQSKRFSWVQNAQETESFYYAVLETV